MPTSGIDQEERSRIMRLVAFASGLFHGDITIKTLLESLAEGVVIIDASGTILLVNAFAECMFGYEKNELVGSPHSALIPERFHNFHREHKIRFMADPKIRPMGQLLDLVGRRKDASEFPLEICLSFLETINGILVLAFVSDITPRKQLETQLRENEQMFHQQIECVKDYAIYMLDDQGTVMNWNLGAERLKGYPAEEVIGKHFSCFYTEQDRNAGKPENDLRKAAENGQFSEECWRVRKDGSGFWAEVIITALRDESGKLWRFSKVTHDITERKKAEAALRESEQRFASFMLHLPAAAWIKDLDGRYVYANSEAERIFSRPLSELQGKTDEEIFPPDTARQFRENDERILLGGGHLQTIEVLQQANHIEHHSMVNKFSVPGADGQTTFVAGVAFDITELQKGKEEITRLNAELAGRAAELEIANRELESFNYTLAHDLRQPLNLLGMYCQAIDRLCSDQLQGECYEYVEKAHGTALRMNRVVDTLLNFSLMAQVDLSLETVNLSAIALDVAEGLKLTAPDRQVDFRIADSIMVTADANLLRVVLDNLVGNAWKYSSMRDKAIIEVGSMEVDGKSVYFVRDNGAGFDMAEAHKLFIPFQRLSGAKKSDGFGVGLATVQRIIQRHGGKVWAEGVPDKGTTFYFTLSADNVVPT